ncbi:hypothetical protein Btru_046008 [Bulinus truncatus]|nr:hypothetical protein Btru_046008 [Bulinus truncatus]
MTYRYRFLGETNPVFSNDDSRCPVFESRLSRDENGYCMNDLDRSQKDASRKDDLQESRSHKKRFCVDEASNGTADNFKVSQRFPGTTLTGHVRCPAFVKKLKIRQEPFYRDAKRIKMEHSDQTVKVDRGQLRPSHGHRFEATSDARAGREFPSDIQSMTKQFPGNARPKPNSVKKQMYSTGNDPCCQGNQNSAPSYPSSGCVAQASGQHLTKTESLTWDPGQTAVTSTPLKPASEEPAPSSLSIDRLNNVYIGEPAMFCHILSRTKQLKQLPVSKDAAICPLEEQRIGSTSGKQRKDWPDAEGELRESSKENTGTRHDNTGKGRWKSTLNSGISDSLFKGKLQHRLESSQQSTDAVSRPGDYRGRLAVSRPVSRPGDDRERLAVSRPGDDREKLGRRLTNESKVNPVRHAKSVDIAAIYSQPPWRPRVYNDYGTVKSDIKPAGGHLPGSDTKTSVSSKVAPSLDKLPLSLTSGDCDDRQDIITDDVIRTEDEEEFRPGMVFLQELHNVDTDRGHHELHNVDKDRGHHAGAVKRLCETKRPGIFNFRYSVPVRRKTLPASIMHTLVPAAIESTRTAVEQILHPGGYSRRSSENFNPGIRNYLNQHSQTGGLHFAKPVTIGRCDINSGASDVQGDKQPEGRLNECFHRRHTLRAYRLNTIEELAPTTMFDAANRQTALTKQRNTPASPQKQSGVGPDSPPFRQIQVPFFDDENLREDVQRSDQPRRHSESFGAALSRKPTVHILPLSRQTSSETLSSGYRSMDRKETLRRGRHFKSGSADANHTHGLSLSLSTCDSTHEKTPRKCRVDSNCSRPAVDLVQIHESYSKPPWIVLDSERCSGCTTRKWIHGDENLAAPEKPDFRVNLLPVNRNSVGETVPKVSNNVLPSWSEVLARQSRDKGPVQSPDMLVK